MAERRYYRVAEHFFSLQVEAPYWDQIANYAPFRVSETEVNQSAFRFALQAQVMPQLDLTDLGKAFFVDSSDDDMPRIEVYQTACGWTFRVSIHKQSPVACVILANADFSEITMQCEPEHFAFALNNAAMLMYAFSTVPYLTLEMHAAVIVRRGQAQLFLGKSGTGKSTHARLWLEAFPSAWLLNDDNPILRLFPDRQQPDGRAEVRVYGSPWSGKTPCYKNASAPVAAIVKLSQAPENKMRTLPLPEAYAYMLSSASGLKVKPEMMDYLYTTISQLIQSTGMYQLDCLPNTAAAHLCYNTINHL